MGLLLFGLSLLLWERFLSLLSRVSCLLACLRTTADDETVIQNPAAFNFVDEDMSGCLDSEEWRRFLDRFKSTVAVVNMRSMFLHLDKVSYTFLLSMYPPVLQTRNVNRLS